MSSKLSFCFVPGDIYREFTVRFDTLKAKQNREILSYTRIKITCAKKNKEIYKIDKWNLCRKVKNVQLNGKIILK